MYYWYILHMINIELFDLLSRIWNHEVNDACNFHPQLHYGKWMCTTNRSTCSVVYIDLRDTWCCKEKKIAAFF